MRLHTMCHNQVSNVYIAQVTFVELIMTKPHFLVDNTTEFDNKIKTFLMSLHVQCSQLHQKHVSSKEMYFFEMHLYSEWPFYKLREVFPFFMRHVFTTLNCWKEQYPYTKESYYSYFPYLFVILLLNLESLESTFSNFWVQVNLFQTH